jgi:hypothetical protein
MSSKEVATLGDGQVFVKRTEEGQMCAVKSEIELSLREKDLCQVPGGSVMITASGLDRLNKVAGLTVIKPPQIAITVERRGYPETTMVENPYIEYSEDGAIKVVTVECLAIGLSPVGNWCITQERLRYDLVQYFAADAWNKVKKYPDCGRFMTKKFHDRDGDGRMWIPIMMDTGLSVDISHPEITSVITGHITRQKFAERIASTICRRNAMKRHPSIAKSLVIPEQGYGYVEVIGWQHDQTADGLKKMAAQAVAGELPSSEVEVVQIETEVKFGDEENVTVEADVSSDDMDQGGKKREEEQQSLFEQDNALEDREKHLLYLKKVQDSLGDKFNPKVWEISPELADQDFSELKDEDLEFLVTQFKSIARKQKEE